MNEAEAFPWSLALRVITGTTGFKPNLRACQRTSVRSHNLAADHIGGALEAQRIFGWDLINTFAGPGREPCAPTGREHTNVEPEGLLRKGNVAETGIVGA